MDEEFDAPVGRSKKLATIELCFLRLRREHLGKLLWSAPVGICIECNLYINSKINQGGIILMFRKSLSRREDPAWSRTRRQLGLPCPSWPRFDPTWVFLQAVIVCRISPFSSWQKSSLTNTSFSIMMGRNRVLSSVGNNSIGGSTLSITRPAGRNDAGIAGIQHPIP
jgi:hypothetical protein